MLKTSYYNTLQSRRSLQSFKRLRYSSMTSAVRCMAWTDWLVRTVCSCCIAMKISWWIVNGRHKRFRSIGPVQVPENRTIRYNNKLINEPYRNSWSCLLLLVGKCFFITASLPAPYLFGRFWRCGSFHIHGCLSARPSRDVGCPWASFWPLPMAGASSELGWHHLPDRSASLQLAGRYAHLQSALDKRSNLGIKGKKTSVTSVSMSG